MKIVLPILFLIVSCAHTPWGSKKYSKKSPAPHLVMFSYKYSSDLGISNKKKKAIEDLKKNHAPQVEFLVDRITSDEDKIYKMSKEKAAYEEIMKLAKKISKDREKLTSIHIAAAKELKNILSKEEWSLMTNIYIKKHKKKDNKKKHHKMKRMKHVNPVPNYMREIKHKNLELTDKQRADLDKWAKNNHSSMQKQAQDVVKLEKNFKKLMLENPTKKELIGLHKKILKIREEIISQKTRCRDYVIKVLDKSQQKKIFY
jgi:hypothetical protein